jgi:hypothetical protein
MLFGETVAVFCDNHKVKSKVKLHYAMKAYGGVDVQIHVFLSPALIEGEWSASQPGSTLCWENAGLSL